MKKVVSGFVVKQETFTDDPTTKVRIKKRVEVSRTFHSRSAAEDMMELLRKATPNGDFYIHEKTKRDDNAEIY